MTLRPSTAAWNLFVVTLFSNTVIIVWTVFDYCIHVKGSNCIAMKDLVTMTFMESSRIIR